MSGKIKCEYFKVCGDFATHGKLCYLHYMRQYRGIDMFKPIRSRARTGEQITADAAAMHPGISADPTEKEQILYLRRALASSSNEIKALRETIGSQREIAEAVKEIVVAIQPYPRMKIKIQKSGSSIVPVIVFSDWHIGETISAEETEGFGEYNWLISQERIHAIIGSFLNWVTTMRNSYRITECVVIGAGDYIAGDIHRELSVTNEFPVPEQTAKAGILFGEVVAVLASAFDVVHVYQVGADNHGRLQPRPQFKQKAINNYSYLVNIISEATLRNHKNVSVVTAPGIKYTADIAGWKFLIEHGDTIKSWMGIPYYGIERARAKEATKRMNTDKSFHYQIVGHWHVPAWLSGNIFINGSLSGTNEFDHGCGRHAAPAQIAFLVHPKHGVFNFIPFRSR